MRTSLQLLCVSLTLTAGLASAQAPEVWVSGVGDDANPCSRTAPCKTLAGSISKVAEGGRIVVLDPAPLGSVTVTKSVNITSATLGSTLVTSFAGMIINAPAATVRLQGISFTANASNFPAISVLSNSSVHVDGCQFVGFSGETISSVSDGGSLYVSNSDLRGRVGNGILVRSHAPQKTVVTDSILRGFDAALSANGAGPRVTVSDSELSGSGGALLVENGAQVNVERGQLVASEVGVENLGGLVRVSNSLISGIQGTTRTTTGGVVHSFGNNRLVPATCDIGEILPRTVVLGSEYGALPLEGFGLFGAVTWGGTLPAGLGVDAGHLGGVLTEVGNAPATLTATDARGCVASRAFTVNVVCPQLTVAPTTLAPVETGAPFFANFTVGGGGSTSSVLINGTLPIGVSADDGGLSGVPTETGEFPLTVVATDGYGCSAMQPVSLFVDASSTFQPTTLSVSTPSVPVLVSTTVPLRATLGAFTGTPTGTVKFFENDVEIGSAAMTAAGAASFDFTTLTVGSHSVTALYLGDATFGGSRAPAFTFDVERIPTLTTLRLEGAELVAEVASTIATPEGQLEFVIDGVAQAATSLDAAGSARAPAPTSVGTHTATARFLEGARFAASTSTTVEVTVVADGGMQMTDAGVMAPDAGTPGEPEPEKPGCGCSQVDVSAVLFAALALFRRRAKSA